MQIIGDRHYRTGVGEQIDFAVSGQSQAGSIVGSGASMAGGALPVTLTGGAHKTLTIAVGFTGATGGTVDIVITGSLGGSDTSRIRQVDGLPFRTALFTID